MSRFRFRALLCASAAVIVAGAAFWPIALRAQVVDLRGIDPVTNQLVRVNPATGILLGGFTPPGGALSPGQQFGGLTFAEHGATLLYQNPVANPTSLFRINPNTGALLSTEFMPAATGITDFRAGLSYQSGTGAGGANAIYAVNDGAPVQRQDGYSNAILVDQTPSGAAFAGALGGDDNGRQFMAAQTVAGSIDIWEFDPVNPNIVLHTLSGFPSAAPVVGLAFDGRRIYMSYFDGRLLTIHPDTGAIENTVFAQGNTPLIGLAARLVPEPSTGLLAILALGAAIATRRRGRFRDHA